MDTLQSLMEAKLHEVEALLSSEDERRQVQGEALLAEIFGFLSFTTKTLAELDSFEEDTQEDLVNMSEACEQYKTELEDGEDDDAGEEEEPL